MPLSEGQSMVRGIVAVAILAGLAGAAHARDIVCRSPGREDVVLALDSQRMLGRRVSCIRGDFLVDLTPCAPDGAWGLSAPTGVAPLVEIVKPRARAEAHLGGITRHWRTAGEIGFEGGFRGSGETSDAWSFVVERRSGRGTLYLQDAPARSFRCEGAGR